MAKHRKIRADRLAALHRECRDLPQGEKTARMEAAAELFGVSVSTLYRQLDKAGLGSDRDRNVSQAKRPELREWTAALMLLASKAPDSKPIALIDALPAAVARGYIPERALGEPIETFHRIAREMGFREDTRKINALAAEYAHQAVLFDASSSAYYSVVKELDDGDYLLKINPRPHADYKNKPVGKDRLRVIVYAFWEMYSGHQWAKYTVSMGENGYDAIASLIEYCEPKADPRDPVQGRMDELWADQGAMVKLGASRDLIERMDIALKLGEPYVKERMGGVEQTHRRRWGFERTLYMEVINKAAAKAEGIDLATLTDAELGFITLSELNARCATHRARLNANPARWQPTKTKCAAWSHSAAERARQGNPIRKIPANAIETLCTEIRRRVDQHGVIRWDNEFFEVEDGLHSRWVIARRAVDDPTQVVVEDIETGKRYGTKPFKPRTLGEHRAFKTTPLEKARDLGGTLTAPSPYQPAEGSNVVALPTRTAEPAHLPNPLEAGRHGSLGEALRAFMDWHGMPSFASDYPEEFGTYVELITESGLSKDEVRKLALELRRALKAGGQ